MRPRSNLEAQHLERLRPERGGPPEANDRDAGAGAATAKRAVIVVHGMGQQLTFQTLDDVAWGVLREHERRTGVPPDRQPSSVGVILPGAEGGSGQGTLVPRATLALRDAQGSDVGVDFYECYWAPLTQGAVGLKAVMGFLWDAGLNGLRNTSGTFRRAMFGRVVEFDETRRTAWGLLLALLVIAAAILFNGAVALVVGVKLLGHTASAWMGEAFINDASWTLLLTVGGLALCLLLMWITHRMAFFFLALGCMLAGALLLLYAAFLHRLAVAAEPVFGAHLPTWVAYGTWIVLLVLSWKARTLIVQYVGDVAAYVQPHKLGRFETLRAAIKAKARAIADVVYGLRDADGRAPRYEHVALVGHSLGSVVAYDMLNDALLRDLVTGGALDVAGRTRLLLTFGSPLDKIEFCFRGQGSQTGSTRENLVAARQPLIRSYEHRARLEWINVHHPRDLISGALDYFDDPRHPDYAARRVRNLVDPECRVPLKAHVEYWNHRLVFERLYDNLVGA